MSAQLPELLTYLGQIYRSTLSDQVSVAITYLAYD